MDGAALAEVDRGLCASTYDGGGGKYGGGAGRRGDERRTARGFRCSSSISLCN